VGVKQGVREMNVRDKVSIHRSGRRRDAAAAAMAMDEWIFFFQQIKK